MSCFVELYAFIESNMDPLWRTDPELPWDADKNRYVTNTKMWIFCCPTNSDERPSLRTSYIGIAGVGNDAIEYPLDDPKAGFFGSRRAITIKDIRDGLSSTLCLAESNHENGPWAKSGFATVRGLEPAGPAYLGRNGQFGSLHYESTGAFSSRHLTQVVFADASVRPLPETLEPRVFEALATLAGGEKVPDDF